MGAFIQDLRYAVRAFARTPGFTAAAILSIALGIGANTFIFSVTSALLLRPLPYEQADRLVILWNRSPGLGIAEDWFSTAQYFDIKTNVRGLEQTAIAIGGNYNLTDGGEPERIGTIRVSSNLLSMLGARAEVGQLFTADDDRPNVAGTAVLGHGTWMRRYGGDPNVVGRTLTLNGLPYQVIGVLPASSDLPREVMPTLYGAEHAEILIPLPLGPKAAEIRTAEDYNIIGRLTSGVTVAQAQAEMDTLTARLRRDHPEVYPPNGGLTFGIVPLQEQVVGGVRRSVLILAGAVGFVLLIACANVANLLLSRALARQREIAIRVAIGASRGRIVAQFIVESVVLALAGGVLGLVFSVWSVQWMRIFGSKSVPRLHEIAIDGRVLLFTLIVSVCAGVLFGLVPALRLSRLDVHGSLKDAGRGSSGSALWGRGQHMRRLLVISELALSVVLLIGAGLLIRSFAQLQRVSPGFNPDQTLTLELTMSGRKYGEAAIVRETYRQLWPRLAQLPGVEAAGGVSALPLSQMFAWGPITVEGRVPPAGEKFINADIRIVGGDYFQSMRIPLVAGRFFNEFDTQTSPRVTIIDEHMARQLWTDGDAVGKRIKRDATNNPDAPWITVIGVVGRVKQYTLDADSRMAMYQPHAQASTRAMNVVLRGSKDPVALTAAVRREIRAMDPDLPIYGARSMTARVDESLATRRFSMLLLSLFAALALGIASIGIYGVMAYLVNQGTRELGIRLALGATPALILRMVVSQGMTVALIGVALGLAGAFGLTHLMQTLLFGVDAVDPLTFVAIPLLLSAIALLASWIPARRAARIDPTISLRGD
jgi:predicted permease